MSLRIHRTGRGGRKAPSKAEKFTHNRAYKRRIFNRKKEENNKQLAIEEQFLMNTNNGSLLNV